MRKIGYVIHIDDLRAELDRAVVLASAEIPDDVIRMRSRVGRSIPAVASGGATCSYIRTTKLLGPIACQGSRRSVLQSFGYRDDDEVEWIMPGGRRWLRLERVSQASVVERIIAWARDCMVRHLHCSEVLNRAHPHVRR